MELRTRGLIQDFASSEGAGQESEQAEVRLVAPLGYGRKFAGNINMGGIARCAQPFFGEPNAEVSPVTGQQPNIITTEHLPQYLGRHSDFAAASYLAWLQEEAIKFIVDAGDRLVPARQNAGATKSTKIVHDQFLPSEKLRCARVSTSRATSSPPELIGRTWRKPRAEDRGWRACAALLPYADRREQEA